MMISKKDKKEYLRLLISDILIKYNLMEDIEFIDFKHKKFFDEYRFKIFFSENFKYNKEFYDNLSDDAESFLENKLVINDIYTSFKYKRNLLKIDIDGNAVNKFNSLLKSHIRNKIIDSLI